MNSPFQNLSLIKLRTEEFEEPSHYPNLDVMTLLPSYLNILEVPFLSILVNYTQVYHLLVNSSGNCISMLEDPRLFDFSPVSFALLMASPKNRILQ